MKIGERIQELRKEKGYSQEKLAAHLKMSRQAIAKWEQNVCEPSLDCLIAMADIFKTDLNYLISGTTGNESSKNITCNKKNDFVMTKKNIILLLNIIIFIGIFIGCFIYALINPIYFNQKSSFIWWYIRFWVSTGTVFRVFVLVSIIGIFVSLKKFLKKEEVYNEKI